MQAPFLDLDGEAPAPRPPARGSPPPDRLDAPPPPPLEPPLESESEESEEPEDLEGLEGDDDAPHDLSDHDVRRIMHRLVEAEAAREAREAAPARDAREAYDAWDAAAAAEMDDARATWERQDGSQPRDDALLRFERDEQPQTLEPAQRCGLCVRGRGRRRRGCRPEVARDSVDDEAAQRAADLDQRQMEAMLEGIQLALVAALEDEANCPPTDDVEAARDAPSTGGGAAVT
ncbi:hypothetical protein M885DRAFT_506461 [Pelagophyceae sp. CCMP2097]|nr:hypothetical protein M885DRAFT_506461 [Pelagophyceae sp. CCMP2097]